METQSTSTALPLASPADAWTARSLFGLGALLLLSGLAMPCLVIGVSQAPALLQRMSPPALLSRSIALFPLVTLPLRGMQAPAVGWLSDRFGTADPRGLLHAMVIVAAVTLALGVAALWRLEGHYARLATHAHGAHSPNA